MALHKQNVPVVINFDAKRNVGTADVHIQDNGDIVVEVTIKADSEADPAIENIVKDSCEGFSLTTFHRFGQNRRFQ